MIEVNQLTHQYFGSHRVAVALPQWSVADGAMGCVLGASGCGKTTLLSVLAGLLQPSAGSVTVAGQSLGVGAKISAQLRDDFRAKKIGIITQRPHFLRPISMRDNLRLAASLAGVTEGVDARIQGVCQQLGVAMLLESSPQKVSVGEAQRFAVARAVLHRPVLLLADEPTSALDDENAAAVIALLKSQAAEIGATLLVVTHDVRVTQQLPVLLQMTSAKSGVAA